LTAIATQGDGHRITMLTTKHCDALFMPSLLSAVIPQRPK
jgi:hypothetical protein